MDEEEMAERESREEDKRAIIPPLFYSLPILIYYFLILKMESESSTMVQSMM